jgi:hypothetical protein
MKPSGIMSRDPDEAGVGKPQRRWWILEIGISGVLERCRPRVVRALSMLTAGVVSIVHANPKHEEQKRKG